MRQYVHVEFSISKKFYGRKMANWRGEGGRSNLMFLLAKSFEVFVGQIVSALDLLSE